MDDRITLSKAACALIGATLQNKKMKNKIYNESKSSIIAQCSH